MHHILIVQSNDAEINRFFFDGCGWSEVAAFVWPTNWWTCFFFIISSHLPSYYFTKLWASYENLVVIVYNKIGDKILSIWQIINLFEHSSLLNLKLISQLVKTHCELIPSNNQIILCINLETFYPLSHARKLLSSNHIELYIFPIRV